MGAFGSANTFPSLSAGDLRHWIQFLSPISSLGPVGTQTNFTLNGVGAWAKMEFTHGAELLRSGQDVTIIYVTFSLWFRPDIQANWRIQAPSGAIYLINSIENVLSMNAITIISAQAIGPQANLGG